MSLYRNIIKKAWNIAWKNKYLWFFGFFAALLGNGGEYEFFVRLLLGETDFSVLPGVDALIQSQLLTTHGIANAARMLVNDPVMAAISIAILILIFLFLGFAIWLVNVSQVALVNNASAEITDKEKGFRTGLETGMAKFWPVLSFNIILRIMTGVLFFFINWALLLSFKETHYISGKILYSVLFLLSIPLLMSLSFIFKYSIAFIVIRGQKFVESLKSGWELFLKNWLISLEMAFVLFFINVGAGLILILVMLMLLTPVFLLVNVAAVMGSSFAFWLVIFTSMVLFMGLFGVFAGALATFQVSAWTTLFLELVSKGGVSKIVRVFSKE